MEDKEKIIKDSIMPISLQKQQEITKQMEKCICKLHTSGGNGTGFFAKIPYKLSKINALITNNHVLNSMDIATDKVITFSISNNIKDIKIGKERIIYTNEKYDITIIEIKECDDLKDTIEYLEIDDINLKTIKESYKQFSNEHFNNLYKNESLYVLNYLGGKEIVVSYGLFKQLEESKIYHKCSTDFGSSGAPILSLESNKLIGVHYGYAKQKFNYNYGTRLPIQLLNFKVLKYQMKIA